MDKRLFSVILILFLIVTTMLLNDLGIISFPFLANSGTNEQMLGKVSKRTKTLERRGKDSLAWDDIDEEENLFAYDSVLTLDKSSALLAMDAGVDLTLGENTLITLLPPEDQIDALTLNLRSGSYIVALKKGKQIRVNNVIFVGQEDSTLNFKADPPHAHVSIVTGAVGLINQGSHSVATGAKAGQKVILDLNKGQATIENAPAPAPTQVEKMAVKPQPPPKPKVKTIQRKVAQQPPKPKAKPKPTYLKSRQGTDAPTQGGEAAQSRPDPEAMSVDLSEQGGN